MKVNKNEAIEIALQYAYAQQENFYLELKVGNKRFHEFDDGFIMFVVPKEPGSQVFGSVVTIVEKVTGNVVQIGMRGSNEEIIAAYRQVVKK